MLTDTERRKRNQESQIRWRLRNPEHAQKQRRASKAARALRGHKYPKQVELDELLVELKSKPCMDCGSRFEPCCLDFDHKLGETKLYCVGTMFAHHHNKTLILQEVAKCELVCSNCHRVRTRDRRIAKFAAIRTARLSAMAKNPSAP